MATDLWSSDAADCVQRLSGQRWRVPEEDEVGPTWSSEGMRRMPSSGVAEGGRRYVVRRLVLVMATAVIGGALTWLFCQGYIWKTSHRSVGGHLVWEPGSLIAVTVLEFAVLGVFIVRAAVKAHRIAALLWVVFVLFVFNVVLTVALFGFPAY